MLVDPAFGTGAVKVTPAHSFEDRQCGERLGLRLDERAFDDKGIMLASTHVAGMDRIKCRSAVIEQLKQRGKLRYELSCGFCVYFLKLIVV